MNIHCEHLLYRTVRSFSQMKNVIVRIWLVNMLIYWTEFGVRQNHKNVAKLRTKNIYFWEWLIYILQNFP